jgi:hypothetical protein
MKKQILNLEDCRGGLSGGRDTQTNFKVISMTNTIDYKCGEYLPDTEVAALCVSPAWTVNIKKRPGLRRF